MNSRLEYFKPHQRFFRQRAILLVLLLAFALRLYRLDDPSLRGDEAATVLYAALPFTDLWKLSRLTDPHPPLYYALLHPWQWLLGDSAWVMRLAGVLASTLSLAALYGLVRATLNDRAAGGPRSASWTTYPEPNRKAGSTRGRPQGGMIARPAAAALLAAWLLALNPLQIWLAQDVRSYPLFTLFGLFSSWALWVALNPPTPSLLKTQRQGYNPWGPWVAYVGWTVACLYLHYYTVFLIAFQGLFVLLNFKRFWPKKGPWLASQVAIGLLILPGLGLAYNFIGQAAGGIAEISTPDLLRQALTALLNGFTLDQRWGQWVSLLFVPVWIVGIVAVLRRDLASGSFWTLFFAVPVLGVMALSLDRPFFKERFLVQAQPAFELLLACGLLIIFNWGGRSDSQDDIERGSGVRNELRAPVLPRLASIGLFGLLLFTNGIAITNYFYDPAYAKAPPWRLYHDYVQAKAQPGDVMLTNFPEASVSYYSPGGLPFYVVPDERDLPVSARLSAIEQIATTYRRIWFLPLLRQGFDEQGAVLAWLDRHGDRVDQVFFPVYNLNLYLSPPAIDAVMIHEPAAFAHGIDLRGWQILDKQGKSRLTPPRGSGPEPLLQVQPGEALTLSLYWQANAPTSLPYTVFTHLITADGFTVTGQDNPPVWGSYPTTDWSPSERITDKYTLTVPVETVPGDYRVRVGWYDPATLERVKLITDQEQADPDHVLLKAILRVQAEE
jgi:hypothetical protein